MVYVAVLYIYAFSAVFRRGVSKGERRVEGKRTHCHATSCVTCLLLCQSQEDYGSAQS